MIPPMTSYYDQPGWAVKITTIGIGDNWHSIQMFGAAFVDPNDAIDAVKEKRLNT